MQSTSKTHRIQNRFNRNARVCVWVGKLSGRIESVCVRMGIDSVSLLMPKMWMIFTWAVLTGICHLQSEENLMREKLRIRVCLLQKIRVCVTQHSILWLNVWCRTFVQTTQRMVVCCCAANQRLTLGRWTCQLTDSIDNFEYRIWKIWCVVKWEEHKKYSSICWLIRLTNHFLMIMEIVLIGVLNLNHVWTACVAWCYSSSKS